VPIQIRDNNNLRMTWGEAEIFIINKLRLGNHPDMIERSCLNMIRETNDPRKIQYLDNICRILENLRRSGQFRDLPNYNEFRRIETHAVELAKFGVMMRGWFADGNRLRQYGMDDEMAREIGEFASEHPNCYNKLWNSSRHRILKLCRK
jgi:hypothetical protein